MTNRFAWIVLGIGVCVELGACGANGRAPDDDESGLGGRFQPSAGRRADTNDGGALENAGETNDAGAHNAGASGGTSAGHRNGTGGTEHTGGHGGGVDNPPPGGAPAGGDGGAPNETGEAGAVSPAAGGEGGAAPTPPAPLVSCLPFETVPIGSYVVEADYWNQTACPGTQCLSIDTSTGAFSVTQGPACGDTVASYPNVLYGSSFGTTSPGSVLPKPVSELASVESSWSFEVGGSVSDHYDVAYDIWFCPTAVCDSTGFAGGLELMIWLNYRNTYGWEYDLGSVALGGYDWEVWTFTAGSSTSSWTYLSYMIKPSMVNSVENFDLLAFIDDAQTRGLLPATSYLYAIQAGSELRSGGVPYTNHAFSVSIQ